MKIRMRSFIRKVQFLVVCENIYSALKEKERERVRSQCTCTNPTKENQNTAADSPVFF